MHTDRLWLHVVSNAPSEESGELNLSLRGELLTSDEQCSVTVFQRVKVNSEFIAGLIQRRTIISYEVLDHNTKWPADSLAPALNLIKSGTYKREPPFRFRKLPYTV